MNIENLYYTPVLPSSYGGRDKLHKASNISKKNVVEYLLQQTPYTLHRPARRKFERNRIYCGYVDEQWEADIVDMQKLVRENNGYKYILTIIDCLSKYLFAFPMKTKSAIEVIRNFKIAIHSRKPTKIRTDKGKEFDNTFFKAFCRRNEIHFYVTQNIDIKAAMVERVNRTIKEKLFKIFTAKRTRNWVNFLPLVVESYNNSYHRTIKTTPNSVNVNNERQIFKNAYNVESFKDLYSRPLIKPKLKIGDNVRIKYDLKPFDKSYYPLWTDRVYKVKQVLQKPFKPQYIIEFDGTVLSRRYYPEQLQKVTINENTLWRIKKVLNYRTRNGVREGLVKWIDYPNKFNQWIPMNQILEN